MDGEPSVDGLLLHALADGELDAAAAAALERRIASDPGLQANYDRILAVKAAVRRLPLPIVTPTLQARLIAPLRPAARSRWRWPSPDWHAPDWRAMAASILMTACLASAVTYWLAVPSGTPLLQSEIVGAHRRSLLAASPVDVASSDRHAVRPWFDGKLGFAPPAPDLAAQGFALVGGRVDIVDGKPVASLVYRHNEHLVSVIAMPDAKQGSSPPVFVAENGYNTIAWQQAGFRFWAVSDLEEQELADLVRAFRST